MNKNANNHFIFKFNLNYGILVKGKQESLQLNLSLRFFHGESYLIRFIRTMIYKNQIYKNKIYKNN